MVFFLYERLCFILRDLRLPPPERFIKKEKSIAVVSSTKDGFFIAIKVAPAPLTGQTVVSSKLFNVNP